jgi:ATP-binding cassette subfamily F protein 3
MLLSADIFPVDLNALAWLEDYLQTWPGTLVVV